MNGTKIDSTMRSHPFSGESHVIEGRRQMIRFQHVAYTRMSGLCPSHLCCAILVIKSKHEINSEYAVDWRCCLMFCTSRSDNSAFWNSHNRFICWSITSFFLYGDVCFYVNVRTFPLHNRAVFVMREREKGRRGNSCNCQLIFFSV